MALSLTKLFNVEIEVNRFVQSTFKQSESVWFGLSEYCSPAQLLDVLIPFTGIFNHQLLVRLVCSLSVINAINSLTKWILPAERPYWWIREHGDDLPQNITSLVQYPLSCETTAGFPSHHSMAFTAFVHLCMAFFMSNFNGNGHARFYRAATHAAVVLMCVSRMYLMTSFAHQCAFGVFVTIQMLHQFDNKSAFFYTLSRCRAVFIVLCCASIAILTYFIMLRWDVDPHWSVRMAFKWCADPSYLRHEASPIFVLARDLGYGMGVALSAPLYKRYWCKPLLSKRIPFLISLEALNFYVRKSTPKQNGRFVFIGYEFARNAIHSYFLLSIPPKLV